MDAEVFRLKRWDEDMPMSSDKTSAAWGYLPFNGGPRLSLGMDFALTEAAYTVVRILLQFPVIRLPAGTKVKLTGVNKQAITLMLSSIEGCKVEIASTKTSNKATYYRTHISDDFAKRYPIIAATHQLLACASISACQRYASDAGG
ncbi:MAG: hypothetical protein Q9171_007130 [Xanthocarpia ochracea]